MDWIRILVSRCAGFFARARLDDDLEEELQSHIDLAIDENLKQGKRAESKTQDSQVIRLTDPYTPKRFRCTVLLFDMEADQLRFFAGH